jgi:hypothetical protein
MMRQEPKQAMRTIKLRVRENAFTTSHFAYEAMIDQSIYDEDIQRAASTGRLLETRESATLGTCYILRGFGMSEDELVLVCRLLRTKVEIVDLYWVEQNS